jgi:large subunit ribosomal protein L5
MNPSRNIKIGKVTLNIGAGKDQTRLEKGVKLLEKITGVKPVKTVTNKRIPGWGLRPGLPIGCKVTLRRDVAIQTLKRLLNAKDNTLKESQFDENGNIAFGVEEYIDIPQVNYDPGIGIIGLEVCVTLERNGFRIKRRRIKKTKIPKKHAVTKQEAIDFMKNNFNVKLEEEE